MNRPQIDVGTVNQAVSELQLHARDVLNRKGAGTFASVHEALGILEDEHRELVKAIQEKQPMEEIKHEFLDQAFIALFAVACIDARTMDW